MIFSFANPKGGVGKSTMAVHLTVWLAEQGARVVLVDADAQSSSSRWLIEAAPEIAIERLTTPDDLLAGLAKLGRSYDYVVVDGPGSQNETIRCILLKTDVALLPCGPSALELRASVDAVRVLNQVQEIRGGQPLGFLIPNQLKSRQRLSKDFIDASQTLGIPTTPGLRDLQAYADASGQGTVVWKMGARAADATTDMQKLFREIIANVSTETLDDRRVGNG
jgi:chromosome partitioning protein